MDKAEFLEMLEDILERDEKVTEDMVLADIDEWDSLAAMNMLVYYHSNDIEINLNELREFITIKDLMNKAGIK